VTVSDTVKIDLNKHHRTLAEMTIPQALDYAATVWPAQAALSFVHSPERYTWSQLRTAVARLRTGLESTGIRPGDKVGIMVPNQAEFPLAWLAVIAAGAVTVPINPRYTARETGFALSDAGASWLIITSELLARHQTATFEPVPAANVIVAGTPLPGAHRFGDLLDTPEEPRRHKAGRTDLVGIQFTSGTTGLPKGCMLTHEYWTVLGAYGAAMCGDPRHLLADAPFFYMVNQALFMQALACGGELHVTPRPSRSKFLGWLAGGIDFAWIDESLLDLPPSDLDKRLKLKKAATDGMNPGLHRALEERFGLQAREWYGSTEVGSGTFVPWDRHDLVGSGSMGLRVPNRQTMIIDENLHEVPPGTPGELCFRGPGMMLGYHNRPEVNAEIFLPGGWFRTGDIARKDADGLHYFLGRVKDMVRRSGENISAAEVEQQIAAMPGVAGAGVIGVPDPKRGEEVKAIVVPAEGADLTASDLAGWLRTRLAPFKIPRYVEFRGELPRTASGKVAKAELRAEEPLNGATVDTTREHL
jgi:acyl-CoA synthetase (AMP-forming)/AMP-acid ligase II